MNTTHKMSGEYFLGVNQRLLPKAKQMRQQSIPQLYLIYATTKVL